MVTVTSGFINPKYFESPENIFDEPPLCPSSAYGAPTTCCFDACAAWRWRALTIKEPGYKEALVKATAMKKDERGGVTPAEYVNANRAAFGLVEEPYVGWCGLGGKPEY